MNASNLGGENLKLTIISYPPFTDPFILSHEKYLLSF